MWESDILISLFRIALVQGVAFFLLYSQTCGRNLCKRVDKAYPQLVLNFDTYKQCILIGSITSLSDT